MDVDSCVHDVQTDIFISPSFWVLLIVDNIPSWMLWGYYASPMMYGQNALVMNEFLDKRWSTVSLVTLLLASLCSLSG